jgi:hypothetical protein
MEWVLRGGDWFLDLDGPADGSGRYLAARRGPEEDTWRVVAVLAAGEDEREFGEPVAGLEVAQDMALKLGIQELARRHGFSPAPGRPGPEASGTEHLVARLWEALARLHAG